MNDSKKFKDFKIYVRNLKLTVTKEQLDITFSKFGTIKSSSVKTIKVKDEDKKFAIIQYSSIDEA